MSCAAMSADRMPPTTSPMAQTRYPANSSLLAMPGTLHPSASRRPPAKLDLEGIIHSLLGGPRSADRIRGPAPLS